MAVEKSLLQEAIAEAKTIRETAIQNAYKALEENITPSIKEMLASKLEEEIDLNEEENEEEQMNEDVNAGFKKISEPKKKVVKEEEDEEEPEEDAEAEEAPETGEEEPDGDEEGGEADGSHAEPDGDEPEAEEAPEEGPSDDTNISDLTLGDLKGLISDLVSQMSAQPAPEGDMGADMDAGSVDGMGDEQAPLEDPGAEAQPADAEADPAMEEPAADDDEEIDLSELLRELEDEESKDPRGKYHKEGPDTQDHEMQECTEKDPGKGKKFKKIQEELDEAYNTIAKLRNTLKEVNLLNSKLLYTTRMFNEQNLSESQKANVIKSFDNAKTPKDVKLVYQTLNENMGAKPKNVIREHKSIASKSAGKSTAAPKMIVESNDMVKRFQQLAGIID